MELIDARTGTCKGNILIAEYYSFEEPIVAPATIHVDQYRWKRLELITDARKMLIEEFNNVYGQTGLDELRDILNSIDQYVFTITAHDYYIKEQVRVSTRNLPVVADRCNEAISNLYALIMTAEAKQSKKTHSLSTVILCLIAYTNPVSHYVLNRVNYALSWQCYRNTLLEKIANTN